MEVKTVVLSGIPNVDIEELPATDSPFNPTFPYLLARLTDPATGEQKIIVRAARVGSHAEVRGRYLELMGLGSNIKPEILGGGRILFMVKEKIMLVGEESSTFGKADHAKTAEMLQKTFPEWRIES